MAVRLFVFCDVCNVGGIRYVEQRRDLYRANLTGRRVTDNRAWFEGRVADAVTNFGWAVTDDGRQVCPRCQVRTAAETARAR